MVRAVGAQELPGCGTGAARPAIAPVRKRRARPGGPRGRGPPPSGHTPASAPRDASHLFERFHQVHEVDHATYGDSGVGRSLSRHLCELMGGELTLHRTAPGQGSTFRVTLQREPQPTDGELPTPPAGEQNLSDRREAP